MTMTMDIKKHFLQQHPQQQQRQQRENPERKSSESDDPKRTLLDVDINFQAENVGH